MGSLGADNGLAPGAVDPVPGLVVMQFVILAGAVLELDGGGLQGVDLVLLHRHLD